MDTSEPINTRDMSSIAVGGCFLGAPLAIFAGIRYALKAAEAKEHVMAHQIEEVEIEDRALGDASGAHLIPAAESLSRFTAGLRRMTETFDKMGARFDPTIYQSEVKKLQNLQKRFETEGQPVSAESKAQLTEAQQLLARYAPQ